MKKIKEATLKIHLASIYALLMGFYLTSCKEEAFSPELTQQFAIQSTTNGAIYNIKVGLPADYKISPENYATLYLLDGEENFDLVTRKCREISIKSKGSNVLVVSIGYGQDRNVDYTPTKTSDMGGGGAPEFLEFIKSQLVPHMEQNYRADTARINRIILGHSFGGLFGAYAFTRDNQLFGNYILLSPSLWFDNEISFQYEKETRTLNKNRYQLVFMGQGELENSGRMQAPFEAWYQTLSFKYSNIRIAKNLESQLDHVGSKNPNIIKGLNYYFQNR